MAADQLDDLPCVADGPICDQEEHAWMTHVHGLPQDPVKWCQDVGAAHVSSDLPDGEKHITSLESLVTDTCSCPEKRQGGSIL
jgi:hypothetical protein